MSRSRLFWNSAALVAPAAALAVLGVYFLMHGVPRIVANERARVEAEARVIVDGMRRGELAPTFVWEHGLGVVEGDAGGLGEFPPGMTWKAWEKSAMRKGQSMWGVAKVRAAPGAVVWARDGKRILARGEELAETDFAAIFWIGGPLALLILAGTTAFAVASLRAYVKSRDDFLAATAHDLATPLVGLRYMIGADDAEARLLNEKMLRLVENIKDFLRLGGRRRFEKEVFDLRGAYADAYRVFAADYRDLLGGEDVPVEGEERLEVEADPLKTVQILWNLLGNELKYAAPHGGVKARFSRNGGAACVEIMDEGPGMSPRDMRRAFDRYYRVSTVLESGKGGFGIGLCVSREFARAMGGSLSVRANSPRGCIFTLSLPLARGAAADTPS